MPEIHSVDDAKGRIQKHYNVKADTLEDYARIAYFLSNRARFELALDELSARLWELYRRKARAVSEIEAQIKDGSERNKFTSALRMEGFSHGFGLDQHSVIDTTSIVLVGAISGQDYLDRIKRGLFFKDMMDLKHGEHTHTLQWLAISRSSGDIGLTNSPSFLYKNIYNIRPKKKIIVPGFKLNPKQRGQGERSGVSFWSWLVDCFPLSAAAGTVIPEKESLFTNSYRCPQNVNQYLIDKNDATHFLSTYLQYRYQKRNWFRPGEQNYDGISGGATSKNYGTEKQKTIPRTRSLHQDGRIGGFERDVKRDAYTKAELTNKKLKRVVLHGREGMMTDPAI